MVVHTQGRAWLALTRIPGISTMGASATSSAAPPARDLQSEAAQQQEEGINQQYSNRQRQGHPVAHIVVACRVPDRARLAHHVSRGKRHETASPPTTAPTSGRDDSGADVRRSWADVVAAAASTATTVARPTRSRAAASAALRSSRCPNTDSAAHDCVTLGSPLRSGCLLDAED